MENNNITIRRIIDTTRGTGLGENDLLSDS